MPCWADSEPVVALVFIATRAVTYSLMPATCAVAVGAVQRVRLHLPDIHRVRPRHRRVARLRLRQLRAQVGPGTLQRLHGV